MTIANESYLVAWFSGTGNTRAAAELVAEELAAAGRTARLLNMEVTAASDAFEANAAGSDARLVILFPVYSWAPPGLILRWVRRLPRPAHGAQAAILAVDGGGGYGAAGHMRRVLARRGWDVTASMRAGFPENWTEMIPTDPPEEEPLRREEGRTAAREFARRIIAGERYHYRAPVGPATVGAAIGGLFRLFGRRLLGQFFIADKRCTTCRLCARTCPVAAIRIARRPHARPSWHVRCESCNRCINLCPENAIGTSPLRIALVTLASVAAIVIAARGAGALTDLAVPAAPRLLRTLVVGAGALLGQVLYFWTFAPAIDALQRIPGVARAFEWTFNADWRRYRAPGFKAPLHR